MAFNRISCATARANTGKPRCDEDFGHMDSFILVPKGTEIATEAAAITESTWTTLINATASGRIYPFPSAFQMEPSNEDRTTEEGVAGKMLSIREGKPTYIFRLPTSLCAHKKYRTFNYTDYDVYLRTSNDYILGKSIDGTKFLPFGLNDFFVNWQDSDGNTKNKTVFNLQMLDPKEWQDYGVWVKPTTWSALDLDGLHDVTVTEVTGSTTAVLNFSMTRTCDSETITGLVKEDILVVNSSGAEDAVSSLTDNGDGTYAATLTSGGADTYTVGLQNTEDMTTLGYEIDVTADITVA